MDEAVVGKADTNQPKRIILLFYKPDIFFHLKTEDLKIPVYFTNVKQRLYP
jgi:hypothetical protein